MTVHTSRVWIPETILEARELKVRFGQGACYVAGSTWVQLACESKDAYPANLISLERIANLSELQVVSTSSDKLMKVGACVPLEDIRRLLSGSGVRNVLFDACSVIGAPAVRNRATLVGNLCYRRGDSVPLLLVLDTVVNVFNGQETVGWPIADWLSQPFFEDYANIVESILIPLSFSSPLESVVYRKVGRREAFSLALITIAARVQRDELGRVATARLAIGGGNHVPQRLYHSEAELVGRAPGQIPWQRIHNSIVAEVSSYSDSFASEKYRKEVAANVLVAELVDKTDEIRGRVTE